MARCGQTSTQGGSSHCWQGIGTNVERSPEATGVSASRTRSQTTPVFSVDFSGAGGRLFSTAQAVEQYFAGLTLAGTITAQQASDGVFLKTLFDELSAWNGTGETWTLPWELVP